MSEQQASTTTQTKTSTADSLAFKEIVPGVKAEMAPLAEVPKERQLRVQQLLNEIDVSNTQSILFFGSKAQAQLTTISDRMLDGVKNKEIGPAGDDLSAMVATIRGFEVDDLDPNKKQGIFDRMLGRAKPVVKFLQQYEEVRKQIDTITDKLERHKTGLLTDIISLDRLYQANLDYFHTLEDYIAAGEEKLRELDDVVIPEQARQAEAGTEVIAAQNLRDLRAARDDLERRVHDLRLTRQVSMQSLPGIRLVQENDKGLVNKINSTIVNTVPLWRQQLATAVTIYRSSQAAETVRAATDLTNELLAANAENLKLANAETRKQLERGVFDIETVKKANDALIATIEESLQIADQGKKMRKEAVAQLEQCETELRLTLASAQAKSTI
ncbi:Toxic anion resistance family protein [Candidatus Methylobacter favarea]|uniref:Toxic anion resistance family protein n=1 Tax=Candidatus Methylobacter favarea TaxID=2707345 RepID=A0A8S0WQS5_9GAMM|nr:toxic anion resistance protein [Candidatus Methylobacter favarea]CAA9891599.1 Toxic anion resistance family protein [Candidatus Methylobacter favarea]